MVTHLQQLVRLKSVGLYLHSKYRYNFSQAQQIFLVPSALANCFGHANCLEALNRWNLKLQITLIFNGWRWSVRLKYVHVLTVLMRFVVVDGCKYACSNTIQHNVMNSTKKRKFIPPFPVLFHGIVFQTQGNTVCHISYRDLLITCILKVSDCFT